ncbi:MAG: hypothetical protein ACUVR4_14250 [Anaerolineae bacterium]
MFPQPSADFVLRLLRLEQQLESYQRLHNDELAALRQALAQVKDEVLTLALQSAAPQQGGETPLL